MIKVNNSFSLVRSSEISRSYADSVYLLAVWAFSEISKEVILQFVPGSVEVAGVVLMLLWQEICMMQEPYLVDSTFIYDMGLSYVSDISNEVVLPTDSVVAVNL